ncbi:MAG: bifunctional folylpolyglutamate synthase/dihydrofolate synthase [Bacteroidales bacterium]|nr:bifunctional folylpolyglutamate synthase/dihydrofolate synthase [Bacteroidales bacterium]
MSEIFSEKRYEELLGEIFCRFPSVQNSGFNNGSYKPGLGHMESFCEILGHPEKGYKTIHVAGTNGKGSVANMLSSTLGAAGLKTGLYTSPHILDFRERMRIFNPEDSSLSLVSKEYVFDFLTEHREDFDNLDLSFFEITTAMAFQWFKDQGVDVAVIEVGLGGRLDSTNIINPDLCVIASIGLDHCAMLGDTRAEIAAEKAGIFKPGVPAVVGEWDEETSPVFDEKSWMLCPLTYADKVNPKMWYKRQHILDKMDLRGEYQHTNLRTVLCAVDVLKAMPGYGGLNDMAEVEKAIISTASRMQFHGRWERISPRPTVLCDIGHNPPALKKNFAQLESMLEKGTCSELIIVYGVMADKDLDSIMPLMPGNATYVFTAPQSARSLPSDQLLQRYKEFCQETGRPMGRIYGSSSVREAIAMAVKLASSYGDDSLVYVGGSTFVVADALPCFGIK